MTNRADVAACVKAKRETKAKKLENLKKALQTSSLSSNGHVSGIRSLSLRSIT